MSDDTLVTNEVGEHVSRRRSLSRRDMIKRTAVAGAAVAWAVPVVEVLGSRVASASSATTNGGGLGSAVVYTVPGVSNLLSSTITVTYEVVSSGTQYTVDYGIDGSGNLTVAPSPDVFNFAPTTGIGAKISGLVPTGDEVTVVSVTYTPTGSTSSVTAQSAQPALGGDPIVIEVAS